MIPAALQNRLVQVAAGGALAIAAAFVAPLEGRSLFAYVDPVGVVTICEGWTYGVKLGDVATPEECDEKTRVALMIAERTFNDHVPESVRAGMSPYSIAAFLSFIYNVGPGKPGQKDGFVWLKDGNHSTMLRLLRDGRIIAACEQFLNWRLASGRVLRGLVIRREKERWLCLYGAASATMKAPPIPLERPEREA